MPIANVRILDSEIGDIVRDDPIAIIASIGAMHVAPIYDDLVCGCSEFFWWFVVIVVIPNPQNAVLHAVRPGVPSRQLDASKSHLIDALLDNQRRQPRRIIGAGYLRHVCGV